MLDYKLLEALALVVREGGFERAAQALHLTQSAVSQRVRLLETQLGRPLLVRATPPYATESGRELLRHYNQARLLEDELAERLAPREESGFQRLPLAVNADSLAIWFLEALAPLLAEQRILLDLTVDDQERTHEQLERGEVAGCLSTLPEPVRGTRCVRLGVMPYFCCAAPAFARCWFTHGLTPETSRRAPAVLFNRKDAAHDDFLGLLFGPQAIRLTPGPRHYVPSSEKFVDMAVLGLAYGLIPAHQARPHLDSGALVRLAPQKALDVVLYWHSWDLESDLMSAVQRRLLQQAERSLEK